MTEAKLARGAAVRGGPDALSELAMRDRAAKEDTSGALATYDVVRTIMILLLVALTCVTTALPFLFGARVLETLTLHLAFRQDLLVAPVFLLAMLGRPKVGRAPGIDWMKHRTLLLGLAMVAILLAGWAGHYLVFQGEYLSRDEQMAVFDEGIFAHGRLLWPIPSDWRPLADALNRRFMLPVGANEFWISAYLPVHSAVRAVVGLIVDPALTSPIFSAVAALCTWWLARTLWPNSRSVPVIALIMLVTSSQVLITSMTAFSMSMHLALNLLWLLLFLKGRWQTHALAVLVGFLATGVHQPLFHPLFALPFLALLFSQRRWRLLASYGLAYCLIAAFWMWWPLWISSHGVGASIPVHCTNANCSSGVGFVERLVATIQTIGFGGLWVTAANLLRFVVWQHPLLVPLALFGAIACWRAEPLVRALTVSFLLPVLVMGILLPWQGHGWGYRYLHPVLGNLVLLACYGFHRLETNGLSMRRPLIVTTATAVILLIVHAVMAAQMAKPVRQLRDEIAAIDADVIIVDTDNVPVGQDIVVNRFDLSNRPKLLIAMLLQPGDLSRICSRWTVAFFDSPRLAPLARVYETKAPTRRSERARELRESARKLHCRVIG